MLANTQYRREMQGMDVPGGIYAHIAGVDIVRADEGAYYVLEDNLRVPSGVSYMLENRRMMMRLFPELFATQSITPVEHYPDLLLENLRGVAPAGEEEPEVAVLTPGAYNSAYFEHAFLAQQMGVELVEGQDLFVQNDTLYMRTTRGPRRVHVLYRRVDDDFLDPRAFRPDSMLGVPGLFAAYRAGRVTLANAIGTGVADDKSIYPLCAGYDPLLSDRGADPQQRADLAAAAGGRSSLLPRPPARARGQGGPRRRRLRHARSGPRRATPSANRSAAASSPSPTSTSRSRRWRCRPVRPLPRAGSRPRHIDLRPYVLSGKAVNLVPGGLTRVALREGSLVVNSSQGGGTKDTWVMAH